MADNFEPGIEQLAQAAGGQHVLLGAIGEDTAFVEEGNALHFREDVAQVVGDEDDGAALAGLEADEFIQMALGGEVEAGAGFIEQQGFGLVDEGAGQEDAAGFSAGELVGPTVGEMEDAHFGEGGVGALPHGGGDLVVGLNDDAIEEASKHQFPAPDVAGGAGHPIVGDDAEPLAEFIEMPAVLPVDAHKAVRPQERILLAGDHLEQGGLATAVRTEDGDVFAFLNTEREATQGGPLSTTNSNVLDFE